MAPLLSGSIRVAASSLARATRPVPIKIVSVGKGSGKGAALMAEEWTSKAARYAPVQLLQIKPNPLNAKDTAAAVAAEGQRVLQALGPGDRLVLLDERGRELRSEDMAALLARAGDDNVRGLVFAIGGPYGHGEAVRRRADDVVRLSALVLNHEVAKIVLAEQIYRGWSILRGEPYHHV
jgi:23S rRNA (pseudouridine1915-N3)-methyltransferase